MDGGNKHRVAINFCFTAGLSATKSLVLAQKVYGNEALNRSKVFSLYCRCCWFGHKWSSNRNKNDSRTLNIHKTVVLWILKEDLRKRKLCACFIPYSLTPEQREDWGTFCLDIIAMAEIDKNCLTKLSREMRPGVLPISASLFSVPLVENEVKRTALWGYCWDPRSLNWRNQGVPKRENFDTYSENVRRRKTCKYANGPRFE